jgi:PEP-CTERM motif
MKFKAPLLALLVAAAAQATPAQTVTYTNTANDAQWPSRTSGYTNLSYYDIAGPYIQATNGYYDAFSIRVNGTAGATINSITLSFRFSGLFDDSVALDLNGNGSIDYAIPYYAIARSKANWNPWSSLNDATNLGMVVNITSSGTTATTYIYGQVVSPTTNESGYINTLANISLSTLGLDTIGQSGYTDSTGSFRIGFLDIAGGGAGHPTLGQNSFSYNPSQTYTDTGAGGGGGTVASSYTPPVPEPSTYGLIGIAALGLAFAGRRRKLKKTA